MNETVIVYGTPQHPTLETLYTHIKSRGRRRVVFVVQERFPRDIAITLGAGVRDEGGRLVVPYEEPIELDDVTGVCLDGFYINAQGLTDLDEADVAYAQAESWATLIALFARLARRNLCVVANQVTLRERIATRTAQLAWLLECGMRVPRVLVTSEPSAARQFYDACGGRVVYKPIAGSTPLQPMQTTDLDRLDALRYAPVHFEEVREGPLSLCSVVGTSTFTIGPALDAATIEKCREVCRRLGLHFAELTLRTTDEGVEAINLRPHLSPESLREAALLDAACTLLEGRDHPEPEPEPDPDDDAAVEPVE